MTEPETPITPITSEPPPAAIPAAPTSTPTPSTQKRSWSVMIFIFIAAIIGACACMAICLATAGGSLVQGILERDNLTQALDDFMNTMEDKDAQTAYSYFSTQSKKQTELADLEEMLEGNNYKIFEGYQSLFIQSISFTAGISTFENSPKGTVASVSAIVSYRGGVEGQLTAIMEQENGLVAYLQRSNHSPTR